jgi:thioredoxin-related protein
MKTKILLLLIVALISTSFKGVKTKYTAYIFYSDTCPMCIKYVYSLNKMHEKYKEQGVKIIAVFSNYYTKSKDIAKFKMKESPKYELYHDSTMALANEFNATITPEVVLVNKKREVLYRGMVDNWFYKPGKYRQVTTEFYLRDALDSLLTGKKPAIDTTRPIGCYLMRN